HMDHNRKTPGNQETPTEGIKPAGLGGGEGRVLILQASQVGTHLNNRPHAIKEWHHLNKMPDSVGQLLMIKHPETQVRAADLEYQQPGYRYHNRNKMQQMAPVKAERILGERHYIKQQHRPLEQLRNH